jgi:hypothetical protein
MSETQISKAIMDYLAARRILAFHMNTGAAKVSNTTGRERFMRFSVPGMAYILAFTKGACPYPAGCNGKCGHAIRETIWLKVKTDKGKQSELQKSFQAQVEAEGASVRDSALD